MEPVDQTRGALGDASNRAAHGRHGQPLSRLRTVALITTVAGLAVSLALMFNAGRRQGSIVLLALFTLWVASPFVGLGLAESFARRWSVRTRTTLHVVMLLVTAGSLSVYGKVIEMPQGTKNAAAYLMVPLGSWVLIAATLGRGFLASRRKGNRTG